MGRTVLVAGLIALLAAPLGQASTYVPGQARKDGLYVPPHFRAASDDRHAAEAWFETLRRDGGELHKGKLSPPPAAAAPPAPSALAAPRI